MGSNIHIDRNALPGPWRRATHRTRGGDIEIRERPDGRFDLRAIGAAPLGWPMPDQVAERGVDAAYVRTEIVVLADLKRKTL